MVTCGSKEPPPQLTRSAVRGTSPFALAGILALVLIGIVLRFMRRRVREHDPDEQRPSA